MNKVLTGFCAACFAATAAFSGPPEPTQLHNSNAIWFENWIGLSNATLRVLAPDGEIIEVFAASGTPVFQLSGDEILDGVYSYELSAATEEQVKIVNQVDNGRGDAQRDTRSKPFYAAGRFVVDRGVIITPDEIKEE